MDKVVLEISEEELEEVKKEMCDDYCKKVDEWKGDFDSFIDEVCVNCPLSRI